MKKNPPIIQAESQKFHRAICPRRANAAYGIQIYRQGNNLLPASAMICSIAFLPVPG
jgi:hypothetical protein